MSFAISPPTIPSTLPQHILLLIIADHLRTTSDNLPTMPLRTINTTTPTPTPTPDYIILSHFLDPVPLTMF